MEFKLGGRICVQLREGFDKMLQFLAFSWILESLPTHFPVFRGNFCAHSSESRIFLCYRITNDAATLNCQTHPELSSNSVDFHANIADFTKKESETFIHASACQFMTQGCDFK